METANDMMVGIQGGHVLVMNPPQLMEPIPKDAAMRMAAWIVALADQSEDHKDFHDILNAVMST